MSHFLVLVVGDNVETQLAPYHEYECTGQKDEYVQTISILDDLKESYKSNREDDESFEDFVRRTYSEDRVQKGESTDHFKYSYYVVDEKGDVFDVISRTNPNAQWDYWDVGGRYADIYRNKAGGCISEGIKGDFDFDSMSKQAAKDAAEVYDKVQQLTGGKTWESWESVVARFQENEKMSNSDAIEAARSFYNSQEAILAIKADERFLWCDIDIFLVSRDDYITDRQNGACVPYAFVKDGKWYARGKMGWWGYDKQTCTKAEWNKQFREMLDSLPNDTRLTVVDCHI